MKAVTVARDLQRRRARERTRLFTAEGVRCVEELLESSLVLRDVMLSPALRGSTRGAALDARVREAIGDRGFKLSDVSDAELASAAGTDAPQGILAVAEQPERSFDNAPTTGLFLVLDAVQDPGNVGTILRTAQAFGIAATIALPGTTDLWNPKVVRSAMGSLFSHCAFAASVPETLSFLKSRAIEVWATAATGEALRGSRAGDSHAIVVGNEGSGVSRELAAVAARTVAIPVSGVESLNVAVATGIILYAITAA